MSNQGGGLPLPIIKKEMNKKELINSIAGVGRNAATAAGVGYGASKVIGSISKVSEKDSKTLKKFGLVFTGVATISGLLTMLFFWCKNRSKSKAYTEERKADADLYIQQRLADGELYTIQKQADIREMYAKADTGMYRERLMEDDDESDYNEVAENHDIENKTTWIEDFKSRFTMPTLPPFIERIMKGVPSGYEEAMLLHLCSMLGAMCFSKVRAKYSDEEIHAPNLQVIVEGNWGTGKAKFEQLFKALFKNVIDRSIDMINRIQDPNDQAQYIIQTTGIGTSMSKIIDILASNQGCHMYIFNSEIRALSYDLKKGNGLNFDLLRKAFENGDVCRNNKAKDSVNGIFPIFLNFTITGTPVDILSTFRKELEGGTLSRIAWSCIPEAGRIPGVLTLPKGNELDAIRTQINVWAETYCFQGDNVFGDIAVEEFHVDLDYVCEALNEWNIRQVEQSEEGKNPARKDVRLRMAAIAFHCAIVLHMLFDNPTPSNWQKRRQVIDLTLYIANYCMERFLHKFGTEQNAQRKLNQEAEMVNRAENPSKDSTTNQKLITDVKELKALHDMQDERGQSLYGWNKLAEISGMSRSTVRRLVLDYEIKMQKG